MTDFQFKQTYRKGRAGEVNVIEQLLEKKVDIREYTNFKEHEHKQQKGFDLEIFNKKTQEWDRADIKTNIKNGFTFLEVIKHSTGGLGWFYTSKSDVIIAYDLEYNHCYIYDLSKMRNYVESRKKDLKLCGKNKDLFALPVARNPHITQLF